ncbi:unnamed protein product [Mycena citricolor]|uniref:HMG box domain-containing protein n=1 Tax=Mycena citricolor TaxID=2018698 RepID=A0AAD2GS62_9AGAR|nr:unnamed protein product [Mycena citricolor]
MDLARWRIPLKHGIRQLMIRSSPSRHQSPTSRSAVPRWAPYKPHTLRSHSTIPMPGTLVRLKSLCDASDTLSDSILEKDTMSAYLNYPEDDQLMAVSSSDDLLFDFDGDFPPPGSVGYDSTGEEVLEYKPFFEEHDLDLHTAQPSMLYQTGNTMYYGLPGLTLPKSSLGFGADSPYLGQWARPGSEIDTSPIPSPSSPIPIPSSGPQSPSFISYSSHGLSPMDTHMRTPFSPSALVAALPRSYSPASSFEEHASDFAVPRNHTLGDSISPHDTQRPAWASQLWDTHAPGSPPRAGHHRTLSSPRSSSRHSPLTFTTDRVRRNSQSSLAFPGSSSAPSAGPNGINILRSYSRRAESLTPLDIEDRDATVRRRKRVIPSEDSDQGGAVDSNAPQKSLLRPPKLAPSAWQLYFTDWIQRQQASSHRKLNVAQAAKEAGQDYAGLSEEEKEPYKQRSQAAKDLREREHSAYLRSLTPDDIKRENAFRSAQRKAGKSRKSNIKDPNAPKKPLSAYFMFLQRIRADPTLVREVFGEETETTKQSILAAAWWRAMSDDEKKPFLAQAEQEKMEYEAARRLYEEGATNFGSSMSSINFSFLPLSSSPAFPSIKLESESEGEATHSGRVFRS